MKNPKILIRHSEDIQYLILNFPIKLYEILNDTVSQWIVVVETRNVGWLFVTSANNFSVFGLPVNSVQ